MKKILSYILLIVWLLVIFFFSNQTGNISGNESGGIIYNVLNFINHIFNLNINNLNDIVEIIHNPIREMMHSVEYLVLALLFMNALNMSGVNKNIILATILFCFIYAASDEIHQLFVVGRSFEYFDILMDMIGSSIGILIFKRIKVKKL